MEVAALQAVPAVNHSRYSDTLKLALYGKFGTRKTLQAGNLIKQYGERVVVVSAEHGLNTIASLLTPANVIEADNMAEFRAAFGRVRELHNTRDWWVVVDGGTRVFNWIANEHQGMADRYYVAKSLGMPIDKSLAPAGRFISDRDNVDMQKVYGAIGRDSERLINEWVKLDCNQYWTFLEDLCGSSGREKSHPFGPDVPGKVGLRAIMSSFDYVGRLDYDMSGKLTGNFDAQSSIYMARTREDQGTGIVVPPTITDFNLADFVRLIQGER